MNHHPLTARQWQVVAQRASGLSTKEVAHDLGIACGTVGATITYARKKLGLKRVFHVYAWAMQRMVEGGA